MANKDTGIVNIHGKEYQTVAFRVGRFREKHPDYSLETVVLSRDEDCVVMKAIISDASGRVIATGHSEEYRSSSTINKTSALENSETSAIGRALAAFGLGGTEFASADEVARAVSGQKGSISPTDGCLAALSKDDQAKAWKIANSIVDLWDAEKTFAAYEAFYEANLTNEMKLGVWECLKSFSKVRNGIKKISDENKKAA